MGAAFPLPQAEVPPKNYDQSSNNVTSNDSSSKPVDSSQLQPADVANTPDSRSSSKLIDVVPAKDENVDGKDDQSSNNVTENSTSSKPYDSSLVQPADAANTSDSPSSELIGVVPAEDENEGGTTEDAEQEEEGECGFCLFMKGGQCKDSFIAWEKCVEEAETGKEDLAQKCFEVTTLLRQCMEANSGYYAPILQVEKSMEEEAASELEQAAEEKPPSEAAEERNNTE